MINKYGRDTNNQLFVLEYAFAKYFCLDSGTLSDIYRMIDSQDKGIDNYDVDQSGESIYDNRTGEIVAMRIS